MSLNKELNTRMRIQCEEQLMHVVYNHEFGFYNNVVAGDLEAVSKMLADPYNEQLYDSNEYGRLSKDKLRNIRYHFVVSVALITRLCVENGLERELAYTLSDLYISKMDLLQTARQVLSLSNEMLMDFTKRMASLPKLQIYSMLVVKAIDYISQKRNKRLTVNSIAMILTVNKSYLSTVFKKETGVNISDYIRKEKIKAATNMLRFSDYSYSDIATYFGFASQSHFIQCFRTEIGITPKEFRKKVWKDFGGNESFHSKGGN